MKKLAILSDTHGLLREQVLAELEAADVDVIVYGHAHKFATEVICMNALQTSHKEDSL